VVPSGRDVHSGGTQVLSFLLIVVGIAVIVRTLIAGGGGTSLGIILGVLFTVAGVGRLWVARRMR
jgi:hypothetical protein